MKKIATPMLVIHLLLLLFQLSLRAQTIPIQTQNFAQVLQVDDQHRLKITHFGKPLQNSGEYQFASEVFDRKEEGANNNNLAFAVAGINNNMVEPAIAVVHTDGNNSIDLKYQSHTSTTTKEGATLTPSP